MQGDKYTLTCGLDGVDWPRLSTVYLDAPLPIERSAERLRLAYERSQVCCFTWQADLLVGACRAL